MVAPLIIAAGISAAGSLAGSALGASAQSGAAKQNNALQIAQMQRQDRAFEAQQHENMLQRVMQERMLKQALAGQVDAYGNRTYFDSASNQWVTIPAAQVKALQDAVLREQTQTATVDATRQRQERGTNFERRQQEGRMADDAGFEYSQAGRRTPGVSDLASVLQSRGRAGRQQARDDVIEGALLQNLRANNPQASAAAVSRVSKEAAAQEGDAQVDAYIRALEMSPGMRETEKTNSLNRYNALASRATNIDNVAMPADSISPTLSNYGMVSQQRVPNLAAAVSQGGRVISPWTQPPQIQPDYSMSLLASTLANRGADLYKAWQTDQDRQVGNQSTSAASLRARDGNLGYNGFGAPVAPMEW